MSVAFSFVNYDTLYKQSNNAKIVINDLDIFSEESKDLIDKYIYKNYTEDNISLLPSCACGELKDEVYIGVVCEHCHTPVTSEADEGVNFLLYARQPEGVAPFMNLRLLSILLDRYKVNRIELVRYIIDPTWKNPKALDLKTRIELEKLNKLMLANGLERSYNCFVERFDDFIAILDSEFGKIRKKELGKFQSWLEPIRPNIFSTYLPFPNNMLLVMNGGVLGRFIDKNITKAVNSIRRLTGIDIKNNTDKAKQTKVAKTMIEMAEFYATYIDKNVYGKPGLLRKHISSTRSHFTARTVITSITHPHVYNEIYIPWTIACTLLEPYIRKELKKEGMTFREITAMISEHTRCYHPLLDRIFNDMIASSNGGIDALLNRNPSLHRGSMQWVKITHIKPDTTDNTFSMSYLIAPAYNADFDGDALNLTLALGYNVVKNLENFAPYHSLLGLTGVNDFSSNIKFPKTVVSNLANWYNS